MTNTDPRLYVALPPDWDEWDEERKRAFAQAMIDNLQAPG